MKFRDFGQRLFLGFLNYFLAKSLVLRLIGASSFVISSFTALKVLD